MASVFGAHARGGGPVHVERWRGERGGVGRGPVLVKIYMDSSDMSRPRDVRSLTHSESLTQASAPQTQQRGSQPLCSSCP